MQSRKSLLRMTVNFITTLGKKQGARITTRSISWLLTNKKSMLLKWNHQDLANMHLWKTSWRNIHPLSITSFCSHKKTCIERKVVDFCQSICWITVLKWTNTEKSADALLDNFGRHFDIITSSSGWQGMQTKPCCKKQNHVVRFVSIKAWTQASSGRPALSFY